MTEMPIGNLQFRHKSNEIKKLRRRKIKKMKTQKAIGILTIISVIAVCLLLTSAVYAQNSVIFSSGTGATVSGGGSSAAVGKACSGNDPYVDKAVRVELDGAGEIDDEDSGHLSSTEITPMGEVIVTVDAELVSAWVKVGNTDDAEAIAEAGISAQGEILVDPVTREPTGEVYVICMLYAMADASSHSRRTAQAEASAEGSASASLDSSYRDGAPEGYPRAFYDVAVATADVEGKAEASAKVGRNGGEKPTTASAWAGLIAGSELGSLSDYSLLGSSSEVVGTTSKSKAEAESSVAGSASASGELNICDVVFESSQTSVVGEADTEASTTKGPGASAFAGAGSINSIPSPEGEPYPFGINTFSLCLSGDQPAISLADASFLGSYTGGELNIYSGRVTAEGSVEAETEAKGSLERPDVVQSSATSAAGEASSSIDIRSAGIAESAAGAASVNLVDTDYWSLILGVSYPVAEYFDGELFDVYPEELLGVDLSADYALLADASVLGSYSHTSYTVEEDEFGFPTKTIINKATAKSEVGATTSASGESVIEDEVASSETFASAECAKSYSKANKNRNGDPWATSAAWVASLSLVDAGYLEIAHSLNDDPILSGDFDVVTGSAIGTAAWGADGTKVKPRASLDIDIPEDEDAATRALASLDWDTEDAEASTNITTGSSYSWLDGRRNRGRCTINGDLVNKGDRVISDYDRSWSVKEDVNWADGYLWGLAYTPAPYAP